MLPKNYQESLICLQQAAHQAGFSFEYLDKHRVVAEIKTTNSTLRCIHNKNPFNSYIATRICQDKSLQHLLYEKFNINHPKSVSYFNPLAPEPFQIYSNFKTIQQVQNDILTKFEFPFIFKKNNSSLSKDVYLVKNESQLAELLCRYFLPQKNEMIIVQEFVAGTEYRVISLKGEPLLSYTKKGKFTNQPSPPQKVLNKTFSKLASKVYQALQVNFCGIDIIKSPQGQFYVIETNANPACFYYNKYQGREDFIQVYLRCLQEYQS